MSDLVSNYGWLDRTVHRMAFGLSAPQDMLIDLEQQRFGAEIAAQPINSPIFVTSLARAGTTLLLDVLARHSRLVAHSYRDMPFVRSPAIWRRFSGRFRAESQASERAHGDGMTVSYDSPEAFEEAIWLHEFPAHFTENGIKLWSILPDRFRETLIGHMRSLIYSRQPLRPAEARYISKNNANIARLPALRSAFADARILLPLRNPLDHAASLLRQHELFCVRHKADQFGLRYMCDIGHFEFGAAHRPLMFDTMADCIARYSPLTLDYWLAYWLAAYRHVAGERQAAYGLLNMESFTAQPQVGALFEWLGLQPEAAVIAEAEQQIRPIKRYGEYPAHSRLLASEAQALFEELRGGPNRIL